MSKATFSRFDDKESNYQSQQIIIVIQKVKLKLMSRELEGQREAVAWLINELNNNSAVIRDILILTLLKSEIIPLLCETAMTMQGQLVTSTLKCLSCLTTSEQFYKQNHASYVMASILRTGHFMTLENIVSKEQLIILESIAYTLEKIFEGATGFGIPLNEICELYQILKLLRKLLTGESQAYRIVFSTAKILSFILPFITYKTETRIDKELENGVELIVSKVVDAVLKLMRKILEAKNPNDAKYAFRAMVMTAAVCAAGISLCSRSNDPKIQEIGGHKSSSEILDHRVDLAKCIYSAMIETVIPNCNKIEQDEKNVKFYTWLVTSLNGIYQVNYSNWKDLSNHLAERGFLQILPSLTILETRELRKETLLLLSRILTTLSSVSLATDTWIGGLRQFQKFLITAFKSLPKDASTWLPFLGEGDARSDALLILFYYNFLRESIMSNSALYLPLIIAYVLSSMNLKTKRRTITMRKATWFTFSIAAVSHEDPSSIDSYETAMTRLFNDLESGNIRDCYTHHPAVVVHCLKSASMISHNLKTSVISLWLENGGDIECIVEAMAEGDLTNYYCLLEMVKKGSPGTVDVAMKAISELISNPEAVEALGNIAWDILQQILAPGYKESDYNTISVLKLAAIFEPNQISGSLLVRLLYSLTSFVLRNYPDSSLVTFGIKNAYSLLSIAIRRNDVRGVTMFTNQPKLIEVLKIIAFDENNDPELSYMCFNCLSTLIRYQARYSIQCEKGLELESEDLLRQLYLEKSYGALKFATALLTGNIEKPLIILNNLFTGSNQDLVIRSMYLQVHVIHSKSGVEGRNLCYSLLTGMLNHCVTMNEIKVLKNLCEMDWTHVLIEITLAGKQGVDPSFMEFISEWLSHRYSVSQISPPSGDRAFPRDQFGVSLDLLGKTAVDIFGEKPEEESLREFIQSLMLFQENFSGNLGDELAQAHRNLDKN